MSLVRSVATFGGYTMLSRIVGFARDMMFAALLGAGPVADAFFVALKLPNFFRALFAEGAFNAAFVPLFGEFLGREGRAAALRFAEDALAILLVVLLAFCAACELAMPWLMEGLAPGFSGEPEKLALATYFTRLTFPYLLFISLVSLFGAVLNGLGRFAAPAATPILFNVTIIAGLVFLPPFVASNGHAAAWGVMLSGISQFLFLGFALTRAGAGLRLRLPRVTPAVKRLLKLILPAALGAGVTQINLLIGVTIASLLPTGAISYLSYADRFYQLPIGVVGVAVGTVLLPLLSRQLAAGEIDAARHNQNRAVELSLALGLPAAAAMAAIAGEMIIVVLQHGTFDAAAAAATADALIAYCVGLPAVVAGKALIPGFYARQDTRTPVKIGAVCVAVNIGLSFLLMQFWSFVGLALASAVAAWLNTLLFAAVLRRRGLWAPDDRLKGRIWRIAAAVLAMVAVLKAVTFLLAGWFAAPLAIKGAALALTVAAGMGAYGLAAIGFGALSVADLRTALRRRNSQG